MMKESIVRAEATPTRSKLLQDNFELPWGMKECGKNDKPPKKEKPQNKLEAGITIIKIRDIPRGKTSGRNKTSRNIIKYIQDLDKDEALMINMDENRKISVPALKKLWPKIQIRYRRQPDNTIDAYIYKR